MFTFLMPYILLIALRNLLKGSESRSLMAVAKVKGYSIEIIPARDSFGRRAQQYENRIFSALRRIGVGENDVDIELEKVPFRKSPASVTWYFSDRHLFYSYSAAGNFVENLYVVLNVIERAIDDLLSGKKTEWDFVHMFSEDMDVLAQRKEARATLGVPEDCADMALINKQYRKLAKESHPDMRTDSVEDFKKINAAHKLLRKELT